MVEPIYDKINDYASVTIRLASPEDIRDWSFGEVKKPETINYRTYRPERDGLFCERIFGPEKDWECSCGKYKGIKHKNITCDKCGVMITHSRVRRKRMGHINLAAPVAHIWCFKAMPSRHGTLLGLKTASLEKVIYFHDYIVIDAGDTPLKTLQLLSEDEYRQSRQKYGMAFQAGMGAESIRELLRTLDLPLLSETLREDLKRTESKQKIKDIIKRLKTVEMLRDSGYNSITRILRCDVAHARGGMRAPATSAHFGFCLRHLSDKFGLAGYKLTAEERTAVESAPVFWALCTAARSQHAQGRISLVCAGLIP